MTGSVASVVTESVSGSLHAAAWCQLHRWTQWGSSVQCCPPWHPFLYLLLREVALGAFPWFVARRRCVGTAEEVHRGSVPLFCSGSWAEHEFGLVGKLALSFIGTGLFGNCWKQQMPRLCSATAGGAADATSLLQLQPVEAADATLAAMTCPTN